MFTVMMAHVNQLKGVAQNCSTAGFGLLTLENLEYNQI